MHNAGAQCAGFLLRRNLVIMRKYLIKKEGITILLQKIYKIVIG